MRCWTILVLLLLPSTALAGSWRVEQDGTGQFTVIQDAVDAAASGDTILIGPGFYQEQATAPALGGWTACAFWDDLRSLTFIGVDPDVVKIGQPTYDDGVFNAGIGVNQDVILTVEGIGFVNLRESIGSKYGEVYVTDCQFDTGNWGVGVHDVSRSVIRGCTFDNYDNSVASFGAQYTEVVDCELSDAIIYFGSTVEAVIRNCTVMSGSFVTYYLSNGLVEECNAGCTGNSTCVSVAASDTVRFYDNVIHGGYSNMIVSGSETTVIAERNDFSSPEVVNFDLADNASLFAQGNHINRCCVYGASYVVRAAWYTDLFESTVDMGGNYWFADGTLGRMDDVIWDGNDDSNLKVIVNYEPVSMVPVPTEKSSLGGVKALFR